MKKKAVTKAKFTRADITGEGMIFEYMGFTVHRISLRGYLVTGAGLARLVAASVIEAVKIIDGIVSMQCDY